MQIVPLFQTLSAMTMNYSGSSGGTPFSMQMSYKVVSKSTSGGVTTYLVDFTQRISSLEVNASAKFQSNGNILWVYEVMNFTGSTAENMFLSLGAPFLVETTSMAQLQLYTSSQFTITGTPIKNFGPTSMQVTDYSATTLPLNINSCGFTETITAFSLEVGTVPGTSLELITQMHLVATTQSTSADFTIQVTSITKA